MVVLWESIIHLHSGIVAVRARRDPSCDREIMDPGDEAGMLESKSEISITSIEAGMPVDVGVVDRDGE